MRRGDNVATFTPALHDVDNDAFATWGAPDGSDTPCNASDDSATCDGCATCIARRTRLRLRCVPSASVGVTCTASTPSAVALDTRHGVFPLTVDIGLTTGVPKPGVAVTLPLPINEGAAVYTLPKTSTNWYRIPDVAFRDVALCDVSECDVLLTVLTCCALTPAASLCSGDVACNVNWFRPQVGAPDVADPPVTTIVYARRHGCGVNQLIS